MQPHEPPTRRRIYLVRHGDVTYFDESGRPHRPDLVPLNEEGKRQAAALAEVLRPVKFDRIVSSDLPRCLETVTMLTGDRGLRIESLSQLREVQPGRLADLTPDAAIRAFLGAFAGFDRASRFLGGETLGELADRVLACYGSIVADESWMSLLIVAHGGVNRILLANAIHVGLGAFGRFEQDPCCLNILDISSDGSAIIRLVNATPYNQVKEGLTLTTMERLYQQYRAGRA